MNRIDEIIAQIRSDLNKYDNAGLIDEISLTRDIIKGLKSFGASAGELQEIVLNVEDNIVELPENFIASHLAIKCEPYNYEVVCNKDAIISSHVYVKRAERTDIWNECEGCCHEKQSSIITENVYFRGGHAKYHYCNPEVLELRKPIKRDWYSSKCKNFGVRSLNNISIDRRILTANFKSGTIYMQYYGLPIDENGDIDVPDTFTEKIDDYLELKAKVYLAERLIANNDAQQLVTMYQVWANRLPIALQEAKNEIKMKAFNYGAFKKYAYRNRLETLKFDIPSIYGK